ncbi:MAG: DUF3822 family protein [Prevotella sp.]|nr:DUF3822 family protein [Prevotella sp.]
MNYELNTRRITIRIDGREMAFSAIEPQAEQGVVYQPYTLKNSMSVAANLRQAFQEADLLSFGFTRAQVMMGSPVMLIPLEEFDREHVAELYRHTMGDTKGLTVVSNIIPTLNAVAVYSIQKDLRTVIEDHFADVKYTHLCIPVWNNLHRRSFTGQRRKLYGYFHEKRVEVFAFQQNRFRFHNSFPVAKMQDAVYFLLYVWKEQGMDQQKDELHLAGAIPERDDLLQTLRQYVQNAFVVNPTAEFNRAGVTQVKGMPYDLMAYYVKN